MCTCHTCGVECAQYFICVVCTPDQVRASVRPQWTFVLLLYLCVLIPINTSVSVAQRKTIKLQEHFITHLWEKAQRALYQTSTLLDCSYLSATTQDDIN